MDTPTNITNSSSVHSYSNKGSDDSTNQLRFGLNSSDSTGAITLGGAGNSGESEERRIRSVDRANSSDPDHSSTVIAAAESTSNVLGSEGAVDVNMVSYSLEEDIDLPELLEDDDSNSDDTNDDNDDDQEVIIN
jgi:hypothetical protein